MIEVNVPKDLAKIKSKVILGLTKRQLICFLAAALVAGSLYFLTKDVIGSDYAAALLVLAAMPFFLLAVYEKNGFPAEKILWFLMEQKYIHKRVRPFVSEKASFVEERKKAQKEEIEALRKSLAHIPWYLVHRQIKARFLLRQMINLYQGKGFISKIKRTAQESLPFEELYADGICKVSEEYYTKMMEFYDINYETLDSKERRLVLQEYAGFLKSFDPSVRLQIFLFNRVVSAMEIGKRLSVPRKEDAFLHIRREYAQMLKKQASLGTNGCEKRKFLIFGVSAKDYKHARNQLEDLQKNILTGLSKLGTDARVIGGEERAEILHAFFNQEKETTSISFSDLMKEGGSVKDSIVPERFVFREANTFVSGGMKGKVFTVDLLAAKLTERFLPVLINLDENITVSMHLQNLDGMQAQRLLKHALMDVQQMKITEQKRAVRSGYDMDIMPTDILTYEKDLLAFLEDLNTSNQKVVRMTLLISVFGKTDKEVQRLLNQVRSEIQRANCEVRELTYEQERGLMACAPIGVNETQISRTLSTDCAAILIPFSTQELFMEGEAFYYGVNAISKNMILADRKKLRTPNGIVLGTPGSGKSFSAKREILSVFLQTEDDIMVCDPEGEYGALLNALHGEVITLSAASKAYLNPLELQVVPGEEEDCLKIKSDFIITILETIAGGDRGLSNEEKGIVDSCIREIYMAYLSNPIPENMPILSDLYEALLRHPNKKANRLAGSMVLFVSGSQNFFNHRTSVDLSNRILCFEIKDLGNQLKQIGMLIVQDMVWNRVAANRKKKKATWYYCDEFHLLLRERQTAVYSVEMWKRFRKWGGIPTGLTQNVVDFLRSPEIEGIISNSDFIYLLNQSSRDMDILQEKFGLSDRQLSYVTNADRGCGLILYDNIVIPFADKYPTDTLTYALMDTKPLEEGGMYE